MRKLGSCVALGGANAADFAETNTCGGTLAGGATCRINVTFTPTVPGNPVASMSISDSSVGSPQTVVLTGSTLGHGVGSRERRFALATLLVVLLVVVGGAVSGCGGGSSDSGSNPSGATGTAAGNYTITVTATAGSGANAVTHTTKLTLVVQ